jgi:hypothetical protein
LTNLFIEDGCIACETIHYPAQWIPFGKVHWRTQDGIQKHVE